ncbi:ATP-binding protein [Streptomyces sp. FxanaA7]|uniref:ATP-binding protein n=1 Tax=Streptomyces sp. FxanaA7 TaxID=1265492 RepID=UPI00099B3A87
MTTKPHSPVSATEATRTGGTVKLPVPERQLSTLAPSPHDHTFEMRFTSTPRGARLARRLAAVRLDAWGLPYGTEAHDDIVLIVAELTANAVRHGHVPGRDFHLRLHVDAHSGTARIEVTDTRAERLPLRPAAVPDGSGAEEEAGRGLLLVSHLATRWDWHPRTEGPGKTVWAEYAPRGLSDERQAPVSRGSDSGSAADQECLSGWMTSASSPAPASAAGSPARVRSRIA